MGFYPQTRGSPLEFLEPMRSFGPQALAWPAKHLGTGRPPVKIPLEIRVSYWIFIYFWGSFGGSFDLGGRDSKLFGKHIQKQRTHRNMINT